ncbi:hypothetical protein HG536_0A01590 [Torulaspora globosa]|uniref:AMP-activated protein kinase glycogen-binding domain-containing protein n=1 Tax=Torulaspora globosa TaxID=48254 RepID=A0A7G3ZA06_9SACH|nr:uncharacterized protein HG536_0A01590 [Torulaspora globosa]QLL30342.1 hypothetical protein HG536_0A01590 [Torulaspora globosa]
MKIIYCHSPDNFQNLQIAGDFSDWKPLSMVKNGKDGLWEYVIDSRKLPPDTGKVHFKFIDDNGVWFTDDDYPKEVDEHSNENNVKMLTADERDDKIDMNEGIPVDFEGPGSPAPSLEAESEEKKGAAKRIATPNGPKSSRSKSAVEDKDESVGGSAVVVNHSDAEDERQVAESSERPDTSGTALTGRENNPEQYRDVLARIIAFFTNLFRSWFG